MPLTGDELRRIYLDFFKRRGHQHMPSASLIPAADPTLLFTSAGMVPFKPYFTGEMVPPGPRLTSCQKSFRTTDVDEVGDSTHLTFFEMLGNFSVGDYFKKEAVEWALEFVTSHSEGLGLPQERFAITVFHDDEEAIQLWQEIGIPREKIYRFGEDHNWWGPAGNEGPCGPCSELHYDFGVDVGCLQSDCGPNCSNTKDNGETCDRFVELWNLVFMQFYQDLEGVRTLLPKPNIDTGMGLDRTLVVLQSVANIYDTDLFVPLISKITELSSRSYGEDAGIDIAIRVVAEHARSAAFLIADGVVPGNDGRGYVLRRVIRRALRHARKLNLGLLVNEPVLPQIAQVAIDSMGHFYSELREKKTFVLETLRQEEERFGTVVEHGLEVLQSSIDAGRDISGSEAFFLYDTYGFPIEETTAIAHENGLDIDLEEFEKEMETQRARGRAAGERFGGDAEALRVYQEIDAGQVQFLGYETLTAESSVLAILKDGSLVKDVSAGDVVEVILRETPFYAEGGGQVGDQGEILGSASKVKISDTKAPLMGLNVQYGVVSEGTLSVEEKVHAQVDPQHRLNSARNHTATHLLHAALRQILGQHVRQAGSLVAPYRLRFDYTHMAPLSREELEQVQRLVNDKIRQNVIVDKKETTYREAIADGALAFFGDKYGDRVRVVEMNSIAPFSREVCGGTHLGSTGEVGHFQILWEGSIGAGTRRIEAVTGVRAEEVVWERIRTLDTVMQRLQAPTFQETEGRLIALQEELERERKHVADLERELARRETSELPQEAKDIKGIKVLAVEVSATSEDILRETGDWLRSKLGGGVIALGAVFDGRPLLIVMVAPDAVKRGIHAGNLARELGREMGGGGGGGSDLGQAGGKDGGKLSAALGLLAELVDREVKD